MKVRGAVEGRDILLITLGFPPARGGIQSCMGERARSSATRMVVIAPNAAGAPEYDAGLPFPVYRWPAAGQRWPGLRRFLQFAFSLALARRVCRHYPIRAIECGQALPFGLTARLLGIPYRIWAYGDDLLKPARRVWARPFLCAALDGAAHIIAISDYTRRLAEDCGAPAGRLRVVPPYVDIYRFSPAPPQGERERPGPVVLTTARLVPRKGVHQVLHIVRDALRRFPTLSLWIAGDGPARSSLERQARELGIASHVRFLGEVPDDELPRLYAACDVFALLPTPDECAGEAEGLGIAYLEAAACGRPCVGWDVGGVSEAVLHGRTGFVVPAGDIPAAEQALMALLSDPVLAAEMGAAARRWAEEMAARARAALAELEGTPDG